MDIEGAVAIGNNYSGSSTAPTDGLIIQGSVGIGTDNPDGKFVVTGESKIRMDTTDTPYIEIL